jgi:hypothetical protein
MRAAPLAQPLRQGDQARRGRGEARYLNRRLASARETCARHHGVLMDVQTRTPGIENLHPRLLCRVAGMGRSSWDV